MYIQHLQSIHDRWHAAREAKQWALADDLRKQLEDAGMLPPDYLQYHPVFETPASRRARNFPTNGIDIQQK